MRFGNRRQSLLRGHERHFRLLLAWRPSSKAAGPIARAMLRLRSPLPAEWRRSVAFDNGTEFARHQHWPGKVGRTHGHPGLLGCGKSAVAERRG